LHQLLSFPDNSITRSRLVFYDYIIRYENVDGDDGSWEGFHKAFAFQSWTIWVSKKLLLGMIGVQPPKIKLKLDNFSAEDAVNQKVSL